MRHSEPSFPIEGATLDLDRETNQFRLKWGDKVNVGDHVIVDSGVVDMLNPIQVIRLVARHSKGIWTDALSFDNKEDKEMWECLVLRHIYCDSQINVARQVYQL